VASQEGRGQVVARADQDNLSVSAVVFASTASAQPDAPRSEYFEVSDNYASAYVGGGYALGKAGLFEPGFRLRAVGAYGPYRYDGTLRSGDLYLPKHSRVKSPISPR
jgi:hypothetical protein